MATGAPSLEEILAAPAMPPPEGETANFDNPPNQNTLAMVIITVTLALSTLCLLLRAYARIYLLRKVQIEEGEYAVDVGWETGWRSTDRHSRLQL